MYSFKDTKIKHSHGFFMIESKTKVRKAEIQRNYKRDISQVSLSLWCKMVHGVASSIATVGRQADRQTDR